MINEVEATAQRRRLLDNLILISGSLTIYPARRSRAKPARSLFADDPATGEPAFAEGHPAQGNYYVADSGIILTV